MGAILRGAKRECAKMINGSESKHDPQSNELKESEIMGKGGVASSHGAYLLCRDFVASTT